jgi:putative DNA primase/helicase
MEAVSKEKGQLTKKERPKKEKKPKISFEKKFTPRPYTKRILEEYSVMFDQYKRLWIYNCESGLWEENAEIILEAELREEIIAEEAVKCYFINEILADVKALSYTREISLPNANLIPLGDAIYNLDDGDLIPYSPDIFFTTKIPTNYNPGASCPTIDRIFGEIVNPDNIVDLHEVISYSMYRDYPAHKMFFLFGRGSNGKSTYTKIIENTLGKSNISSVSLYELQANRFAGAELFGKYVNISSELEYRELKKTTLLKRLCGGDLIRGEHKYRNPFHFHNHAKLVFLTNELPRTIDKTIAFYRRIHLIEFPNIFEGENDDKLLLSRIAPEEYEGLASFCLNRLKEIRDKGFALTNEGTSGQMAVEYEKLTNPLATFLEEETQEDFDGLIAKDEFEKRFHAWVDEKGYRRKWTPTQIGKEMKDRGVEGSRRNIESEEGNSLKHCWLGLKWK